MFWSSVVSIATDRYDTFYFWRHRKKLEKEHVSTLKKVDKDCDQTDENFYDTNNAKNSWWFEQLFFLLIKKT